MRAIDIEEHMRRIGTWVDWQNTCDRFIIGEPDTQVTGIAVAWQSSSKALDEAVRMNCNLFVTHEPTFYRHLDDDESVFAHPHAAAKRAFIREHGLVIYRCHDVWDRMPDIGIVDSWAEHLGLTQRISAGCYESVYLSPANTLLGLAEYVASKTRDLGQEAVEMIGEAEASVSAVGIGCGAITNVEKMVELGADAVIVTDDGIDYWRQGAWALDRGTPMLAASHCVAEEPGIRNLAAYIARQFAGVSTFHIPHHPPRWVTGAHR